MECPSALAGGRIPLFHQLFPVANYPELAQRATWYQPAERDGALSNYVGHEIDVVTKKRSATVPLQAQGHGQHQWHIIGGTTERLRTVRLESRDASSAEDADRQVIRSGTLEIISADPLQAAEQLRNLAMHLSGFVVSSKVTGSDERMQSAQVTLRIPADHFDEARAQVRAIAKSVEQDMVEARNVTREYVDQEAALRNARAEEQQYLLILKRAASVKDVLEVSSKLAEVRAHIDELQADLRSLHHQVEMSLLTTNVTATVEAQVFGIRWRPLYKTKLALRGALSAVAEYGDSMVELLVNLPVIAIWGFTILALLKVGWIVLRRIVLVFFPSLGTWLRRPIQTT